MTMPNRDGSPSLRSTHCRPPSSLRKKPQWFCWYRRPGIEECDSILCVHWPNSGKGSGEKSARTPAFIVDQLAPPSSVPNTPTADMPTHIRSLSAGSSTML